jgi:hypothetical protein
VSRTATRELNLTRRHTALLDAVAAGRAQITCSHEPDIYVDGLCCTDHAVAGELARHGLVVAAIRGRLGELAPAALTSAGVAVQRARPASVSHG